MKAILNYWNKNRAHDVLVEVGDIVMAKITDFGLIKGNQYEILAIPSIDEIIIVDDLEMKTTYTVEYFKYVGKTRKVDLYENFHTLSTSWESVLGVLDPDNREKFLNLSNKRKLEIMNQCEHNIIKGLEWGLSDPYNDVLRTAVYNTNFQELLGGYENEEEI